MNSYAKSGRKNAPDIVEKLLRELTDIYEATGDGRKKPNSRSINTCLDAWARSGLPNAAQRIRGWIDQMHAAVENGTGRIVPDKWAYNVRVVGRSVALVAATLCVSSPLFASPTLALQAYLQALSRSGADNITEIAEAVLTEQQHLYEAGHNALKPDV